jgi:hypothetical protein
VAARMAGVGGSRPEGQSSAGEDHRVKRTRHPVLRAAPILLQLVRPFSPWGRPPGDRGLQQALERGPRDTSRRAAGSAVLAVRPVRRSRRGAGCAVLAVGARGAWDRAPRTGRGCAAAFSPRARHRGDRGREPPACLYDGGRISRWRSPPRRSGERGATVACCAAGRTSPAPPASPVPP